MIPRQEEFFLNVRRAVRLQQRPIVTADSGLVDPDPIARILERAASWLTPKIVARYDPEDFSSLPADQQDELRGAVEGLHAVAASVSPGTPLPRSIWPPRPLVISSPPSSTPTRASDPGMGGNSTVRLCDAPYYPAICRWLDDHDPDTEVRAQPATSPRRL
jgi:hypothetical protein